MIVSKKQNDFAYKLIRAFPHLKVEPTIDGRFRLGFANGQYLFLSASSSPGYWRCLRNIVRRKMEG
jgi:hypothetical protein